MKKYFTKAMWCFVSTVRIRFQRQAWLGVDATARCFCEEHIGGFLGGRCSKKVLRFLDSIRALIQSKLRISALKRNQLRMRRDQVCSEPMHPVEQESLRCSFTVTQFGLCFCALISSPPKNQEQAHGHSRMQYTIWWLPFYFHHPYITLHYPILSPHYQASFPPARKPLRIVGR